MTSDDGPDAETTANQTAVSRDGSERRAEAASDTPPPDVQAARREAALARAAEVFGGSPPETLKDVARLLDVSPGQLRHALYVAPATRRYASFEIPKRTGGLRRISAPIGVVRQGQTRLAPLLAALHEPHPASHGFLPGRSVLSNAELHADQRLVLNIDLADFFPTINFGRVRGLLQARPFFMGPSAATICAQLCTFENGLPQGAPTSPVLSNFIATGLDRRLSRLARANRMRYSRYADDITFSTRAPSFPAAVCTQADGVGADAPVTIGPVLEREIAVAGFEINAKKVRLQRRSVRQSVTGVTVNEKPNVDRKRIRRIRAMIHAWRKFGLAKAGRAHVKTQRKGGPGANAEPDRAFRNSLYGELAYVKMIRGDSDPIYLKFASQLLELDPNPPRSLRRMVFGADDYEVFISHASEDKAAIARPIFEACEKLGVKAFLDEEHIGWGQQFAEKINVALGASRLVLAIVSDNSVTKDWPLAEINTALALEVEGEKTVAALVVGRPDLSKLPLIRQKNYMVWEGDAAAVAARIKHSLAGAPEPAQNPARPPKAPSPAQPGPAPSETQKPGVVKRGFWGRVLGRRP